MDDLACLLVISAAQDAPLPDARPAFDLGFTTALVADLLARGYRPSRIASRLELIGLSTTIALFALPVADAFAGHYS
jgi:hypothetical protein